MGIDHIPVDMEKEGTHQLQEIVCEEAKQPSPLLNMQQTQMVP